MPSAPEILLGLGAIANQWRSAAIVWHVALGLSLVAILAGWRPSARSAAYALVLPLLSVSVAAFAFGNPANGMAFAALSVALGRFARRLPRERVHAASPVIAGAAALLVAFGWGYPHFVETDHWTEYAYAAPVGLLPCPTLALVTGLSIACGQFSSRAWTFTLASAGLVYGAIGVFVLGVTLDYVLLAGAVTVIASFATSLPRKALPGGAT